MIPMHHRTEVVQLIPHLLDPSIDHLLRWKTGGFGFLFDGQAKGIPADRTENISAARLLIARHHIIDGDPPQLIDAETIEGRIGKHVETVEGAEVICRRCRRQVRRRFATLAVVRALGTIPRLLSGRLFATGFFDGRLFDDGFFNSGRFTSRVRTVQVRSEGSLIWPFLITRCLLTRCLITR